MREYLSEYKITWGEISPLFQKILQQLEAFIIDNKNKLEKERDNRIASFNSLDTTIRDLQKYDFKENYDGYTAQCKALNSKNHATYWADIFQQIRFTTNSTDFQTEKDMGIDMKTIFDTWYRYAHYDTAAIRDHLDHTNWLGYNYNVQNDKSWGDQAPYLNRSNVVAGFNSGFGWGYNATEETIRAYGDNMSAVGFISPFIETHDWRLKTLVDVGWDDDNLMIIVGFTKDNAGVEHTLSLVRGAGNIGWASDDTFFFWGLIYDMCNPTQYIITDLSSVIGHSPQPTNYNGKDSHTYCYMQAQRTGTHYEFQTTQFNRSPTGDMYFDPKYKFTFDFPSSNPGWPNDMYENMKKMCTKPSNVGFGSRSGEPSFKVLEATEIFQDEIMNAEDGKVYKYDWNSKTWYPIGSIIDSIKPRTIIYNKTTKHLYWYLGADNYEELRF